MAAGRATPARGPTNKSEPGPGCTLASDAWTTPIAEHDKNKMVILKQGSQELALDLVLACSTIYA